MYPHAIRLRGPWEYEPLAPASAPPGRMTLPCRWAAGGLTDFAGTVRFRRRFGYPGRIDAHERVWLTFRGVVDRAEVSVNGVSLGRVEGEGEFEVTALLGPRNELVADVEGPADGGLCGEVALEVRCTAFLRGVRVWEEGGALHAAGEVVGTADGELELYMVADRSTAAYERLPPGAGPRAFHLVGGVSPAGGAVQIDLVNGASVWYSVFVPGPQAS